MRDSLRTGFEKGFYDGRSGWSSPSLSIVSFREKPHKRFSLSHFIALFVIPPSFILFIFTHFAFYIYISMKKSLNDFNVTAAAQTPAHPCRLTPSLQFRFRFVFLRLPYLWDVLLLRTMCRFTIYSTNVRLQFLFQPFPLPARPPSPPALEGNIKHP